ncbi:MAG: nucleotidyltransferase family protein [Ardenticatenaceae bacterium]
MISDITNHCIAPSSSIRHAMGCINSYASTPIVLVVDEEYRLLDTITDGDIRRAILAGLDLDGPVSVLKSRKVNSPYPQPVTASASTDSAALLRLMQEHSVRQVPLLDERKRVVGLMSLRDLLPSETLSLQAVVMAGGYGTRLRPLTENMPKPMLPIGDRPLLELIISQLSYTGIRRINLTTHYKGDLIAQHFGDGKNFGVEIRYVEESQPLGTAGSLSLLDAPNEPLLVMNGDILTQVDFRAMFDFHQEHQAAMTVAVRQYDFQVPYGVLECEGYKVRQIREKPTYNFFVNAGIYLLEPELHCYVPNNQRFDMTDLIEILISQGKTVISFPILEYWLDIGQHADYEQAQLDMKEGRFSS